VYEEAKLEAAPHLNAAWRWFTILRPPSLWQKAGKLMEPMRQEVHEFSSAAETLLGYEVKLEELTVMEREVIHYYLSAIGEKFMTHQLHAD